VSNVPDRRRWHGLAEEPAAAASVVERHGYCSFTASGPLEQPSARGPRQPDSVPGQRDSEVLDPARSIGGSVAIAGRGYIANDDGLKNPLGLRNAKAAEELRREILWLAELQRRDADP
jgi:hypothetical protein